MQAVYYAGRPGIDAGPIASRGVKTPAGTTLRFGVFDVTPRFRSQILPVACGHLWYAKSFRIPQVTTSDRKDLGPESLVPGALAAGTALPLASQQRHQPRLGVFGCRDHIRELGVHPRRQRHQTGKWSQLASFAGCLSVHHLTLALSALVQSIPESALRVGAPPFARLSGGRAPPPRAPP